MSVLFQGGFARELASGVFADVILRDPHSSRTYRVHRIIVAKASRRLRGTLAALEVGEGTSSDATARATSERRASLAAAATDGSDTDSGGHASSNSTLFPMDALSSPSPPSSSASYSSSTSSSELRRRRRAASSDPLAIIGDDGVAINTGSGATTAAGSTSTEHIKKKKKEKRKKKKKATRKAPKRVEGGRKKKRVPVIAAGTGYGDQIPVVDLTLPDRDGLMPLVLDYMYTGVIDINAHNSAALLAVADHYDMPLLKTQVSNFIKMSITRENCVEMLGRAVQFNAQECIVQSIEVLSRNFHRLGENLPLSQYSPDVVYQLLSHASLAVDSEYHVYTLVCYYLSTKGFASTRTRSTSLSVADGGVGFAPDDLLSFPDSPLSGSFMYPSPGGSSAAGPSAVLADPAEATPSPQRSSQEYRRLWECVRYPLLTVSQLEEVCRNPDIPPRLLVEGLLMRLKRVEGRRASGAMPVGAETSDENVRASEKQRNGIYFSPRNPYGVLCTYRSDFDKRGVLFYVATNGGTMEWTNPAIPVARPGFAPIKVSASSIQRGSPLRVLEREPTEFWTKDIPSSWFEIDFLIHRQLQPTHYTLRHGGNYKADSLRNWDLQGSNDGQQWDVLSRHQNDTSLDANFSSASWPVQTTQSYRYLRIIQTGRNSSNHNFLCLSGFEVYGELFGHPKY